jgi:hypothetical protein
MVTAGACCIAAEVLKMGFLRTVVGFPVGHDSFTAFDTCQAPSLVDPKTEGLSDRDLLTAARTNRTQGRYGIS